MTPEESLVAQIGGAAAEPQLTAEELADCLFKAATPDAAGLFVNDTEWDPSYDIHRAAAAAWRIKAAKVAADYSFTVEGRELQRGQMVTNFLTLANEHARLSQPRYFAAPTTTTESWRV